jgi:hypothetical protein
MANQNQGEKKKDRRFLGKVQVKQLKFGPVHNILVDNPNPVNQDGSANKYYKGTLLWCDNDGRMFQVKQMEMFVPKDGMPADLVQRGFTCYITIDLENGYHVTLASQQG